MENSLISSVKNEYIKAKKVYLDKDPIEDNIKCSKCLINLKYFCISTEESIFKCQTENCWYPYRKFIYKNSVKKLVYFYEPIISKANDDNAPEELNNFNYLLDLELKKKINDLSENTASLNLINDLDYLINEFNETEELKYKADISTATKIIAPRRLTKCKEVIKNNELLLNNNLLIKKQLINNKSLISCDNKKLTRNLSTKFKNENLLNIIKKEKNKIEAKKVKKVFKSATKQKVVVDEVVINNDKTNSVKSENINEIKQKECNNEFDLSTIDFNFLSENVTTNGQENKTDSKSFDRKEEFDSFSYNENLLFYEINRHMDDNCFDKSFAHENKDSFDFNSLLNGGTDNQYDDVIILSSNNVDNTIKIEANNLNDSTITPDLLPTRRKSVESNAKREETKEKPTIIVKKGRKRKDNVTKKPTRRSARIQSIT